MTIRARLILSHVALCLLVVVCSLLASQWAERESDQRGRVRARSVATVEALATLGGRASQEGFAVVVVGHGDEKARFFAQLLEIHSRCAELADDAHLSAAEQHDVGRVTTAAVRLRLAAVALFAAFEATHTIPQEAVVAYDVATDELESAISGLVTELYASRARDEAETHALTGKIILAIGFMALLVAILCGALLGHYLVKSLVSLRDAATAFGKGSSSFKTHITSNDEVGQLAGAFDEMAGLVATRSTELTARNGQMRTLLDHVVQGFVTIGADGRIGPETSAIVTEWFGVHGAGDSLAELIGRCDTNAGLWFELAWEGVVDDSLPLDAALAQIPSRLTKGAQIFSLEVKPISLQAGVPVSALVVITDITESVNRERANETRLEVMTVLERALDDRLGLAAFVAEGNDLVETVAGVSMQSPETVKRALHTLKGNASLFGFASISALCHTLESEMDDTGELSGAARRRDLRERWSAATGMLSRSFSKARQGSVEVERADFDALEAAVARGASYAELERRLGLLALEPIAARFARVRDQATNLASGLEKQLVVELHAEDLRYDGARWQPFWAAFAHVVRNAVDHGIETPTEREQAGKPAAGSLALRAGIEAGCFVLELADDGRGVDWAAVTARGLAAGLAVDTGEALELALFAEGVSTRASVSQLSGRGVGLSAVRAASLALGGMIRVSSTAGAGTTLRFVFPIEALGDAYRTQSANDFHQRSVA